MKIKLNRNMKGYKKGEIIDLSLCSASDGRYWRRVIKDSPIDKGVSEISDEEIEKERAEKLEKRKKEAEEIEKLKKAKLKINGIEIPIKKAKVEIKTENGIEVYKIKIDLNKSTKDELLKYAKEKLNLELNSEMIKKDIIKKIMEVANGTESK